MVSVGQPLPAFSVLAAVSGRTVSPALFAGTGVLVVHGAKTADAAKEVSKAVRTKWPQPGAVALATVVDLRAFAGIWKKVAEAQLKSTYEKLAAKAKEAGMDPAEQVLIGTDWDGAASQTLGVEKPDEEAVAYVLQGGKVTAVCKGKEMAAAVVAALT